MNEYMNFDEAVSFLNTTRSTLYKWLQAGKVPGHKLGRQWRFLTSDLLSWRDGHALDAELRKSLEDLNHFFNTKTSRAGKGVVMTSEAMSVKTVSENLLGDACQTGASDIHVVPRDGGYVMRYRTDRQLEKVVDLDHSTFEALNNDWRGRSVALGREDRRRFTFQDEELGDIVVHYQSLETSRGARVTMGLIRLNRVRHTLDQVCPESSVCDQLRTWVGRSHGLIICAGGTGSGKTTTLYGMLHEAGQDDERVVFSLEDPIGLDIPGVDQIEVDFSDERSFRQTFENVFRSDLDVVGIGGGYFDDETLPERAALSAAKTGHIVILQVHANSAKEAIEKVCQRTEEDIRPILLGVVWQELLRKEDGSGRYPCYDTIEGDLVANL